MTHPEDDIEDLPYADPIDYLYWASKPYWTIDEAAALMLDGALADIKGSSDKKILGAFGGAKQLIAQSQTQGDLPRAITPRIFKAWLETWGLQGAPPALAKAIDDFEDGPKGTECLRKRIKELAEENQQLSRKSRAQKPTGERETETLLIMIFAMAKQKFGYDPSMHRQDAVKKIANAISATELTVSDDTIRDKLKSAAAAYQERLEKTK